MDKEEAEAGAGLLMQNKEKAEQKHILQMEEKHTLQMGDRAGSRKNAELEV
jgi:hypothetical protein